VVSDNRDQLPFAWRVLNHGVCDGCALGTTGLKDWTIDGVHLCMVRLELMRLTPPRRSILNASPTSRHCWDEFAGSQGSSPRPGEERPDKPGNMQVHCPESRFLLAREEFDIASRAPERNR
jgi:hypothetical protein